MQARTTVAFAITCLTLLAGCRSQETVEPVLEPAWTSIFNGEDLDGWTPKFVGHPLGVNARNTFRVEDGAIVVSYDEYDRFDGDFGHLFYAHEHGHYRLQLEYRFTGDQTPGAPGWAFRNSGIMVHGQPAETMRLEQSFPVSIEVQLLGGNGRDDRTTGNLCTPGTHVMMDGELVKRHCIDSSSPTFHGDGWVTMEVEVRGAEIVRHFIEGEAVLEYTAPQLDPGDSDAAAWIDARGREGLLLEAGTISLQAEGHACAFRNIEIMSLE